LKYKTFSQRYGYESKEIQLETMDEELKNSLWNEIQEFYLPAIDHFDEMNNLLGPHPIYKILAKEFLKIKMNELYNDNKGNYNLVLRYYNKFNWYKVYDFIEFLANYGLNPISKKYKKIIILNL
jgi:hypothetical protein